MRRRARRAEARAEAAAGHAASSPPASVEAAVQAAVPVLPTTKTAVQATAPKPSTAKTAVQAAGASSTSEVAVQVYLPPITARPPSTSNIFSMCESTGNSRSSARIQNSGSCENRRERRKKKSKNLPTKALDSNQRVQRNNFSSFNYPVSTSLNDADAFRK